MLDGFDNTPPVVAKKAEPARVRWVRYRSTNPEHCDICVERVHANWPHGTHAPNLATYRRTGEHGVVAYYCWEHSVDQRAADGLDPIKRGA